jgi:DNA-binding transcriptional LysR family regulator
MAELDQWLGIEVRHLAALQSVAETSTFRAAAAQLGYTQSAIIQQIATLERLVGAKLIERPGGPRPVSLSDTGRLVLRHAQAIIARLHAAQADVTAILQAGAGRLRLGVLQSAGSPVLPELLRRFRVEWPHVEVQLKESVCENELLACVERGDLDISFAVQPLPDGPFEVVELMRDPWVLLVPVDSPLAERRALLSLREVAELPLIGARSCRIREHMDAQFRAGGVEPSYVFRADENKTVHGLVATGAGIGLINKLGVNPNDERVRAIELTPTVPPRVLGLAWHRDRFRSRMVETFVELAREVCSGVERPRVATVDAVVSARELRRTRSA